MKKQENSYAPMRIGFYENRFQNQTIQQLTDEFNRLARSRGWTAERSFFSVALMNEMLRRGVDVSAIVEKESNTGQILAVRYIPIRYDGAFNSLIVCG